MFKTFASISSQRPNNIVAFGTPAAESPAPLAPPPQDAALQARLELKSHLHEVLLDRLHYLSPFATGWPASCHSGNPPS